MGRRARPARRGRAESGDPPRRRGEAGDWLRRTEGLERAAAAGGARLARSRTSRPPHRRHASAPACLESVPASDRRASHNGTPAVRRRSMNPRLVRRQARGKEGEGSGTTPALGQASRFQGATATHEGTRSLPLESARGGRPSADALANRPVRPDRESPARDRASARAPRPPAGSRPASVRASAQCAARSCV